MAPVVGAEKTGGSARGRAATKMSAAVRATQLFQAVNPVFEHFLHIFIPGTPENMALAQFAPMAGQITQQCWCLWCRLRKRF